MMALVTMATHTGTETVLGAVTQTLTEQGTLTHVTVTGTVVHETVRGLPLPAEEREGLAVTLVMLPVKPRHPHLMTVELLAVAA